MNGETDVDFFKLRKEAKTYISKLFIWNEQDTVGKRNITMVMEGSDEMHVGEISGAMCLRLTGNVRKTQVTAVVTQDDRQVKRLTLQTFKSRKGGWIQAQEKEEFTFRNDEFQRLREFLFNIQFIDLSNEQKFQIEDISKKSGPKAIVDVEDRDLLQRIREMTATERSSLLTTLQGTLSQEEINVLLGRRQGLDEFSIHVKRKDWSEADWQDFFEREQWVFGYGLDYRVMRQFGREMTVGDGGTDNQNKPVTDFLMSFRDYTVLVEIKKPDTPIFRQRRGGRAGTWEFSSEFMSAVSQVLEQKAEWLNFAQSGEHYNRAGTERLSARTKNAKTILVIGSRDEFVANGNERSENIKRDTFELFRRETRNIDIVTFDELLERAQFITQS